MRRTTVFAGWLHAGLIVIAAGNTLFAQHVHVSAPAPHVSAPAPRASTPAPRASTPAPRASTPSTPRPTTPGNPHASTPSTPRPTTPVHSSTITPNSPRAATPNSPRAATPNSPRAATPNSPRAATPNTPRPTTPNNPRAATPGKSVSTSSGGHVVSGSNGKNTYRSPDNKTTARIQNGRVTQIKRPDTVIRRPAGGPRTVVGRRADNRVVMARGSGRGYVQRSVMVGHRSYVQRTYWAGGRAYFRAYRPVMYFGVPLNFYAPIHFYPVALYGWAAGPWGMDGPYAWGWAGDPWYGYYGPYFRPWGVYPRASFWLTDYMIASTLQAAFQARAEARAEAQAAAETDTGSVAPQAPMSDAVKEMIEAEVRRQLAEAQAEAQAPGPQVSPSQVTLPNEGLPPSFSGDGSHLFLASDTVEVENTATGATCVIGGGDAIQMNGALPRGGGDATLRVLASKGSNCPVGSTVSVPVTDLVEMHNNMRESIEKGLDTLRSSQGTGNLPKMPAEAAAEPVLTEYAAQMHPDADAQQVIAEEAGLADQIEREVTADASVPADAVPVAVRGSGLLATVQRGQSEGDVVRILGRPLNVSFHGGLKKVYQYPDGKVLFSNGEVADVQLSGAGAAAAPAPVQSGAPAVSRGGIAVGQSEREVISILGRPLNVSFQGGLRKVYEYRDRKIVFVDGAVAEP
jgi:hypothetical protein